MSKTMTSSRRDFLKSTASSTAVVSFGTLSPQVLLKAAAHKDRSRSDRVVVFVQLTGGNDGLNTVVPFKNDVYREHRKTLAISRDEVLKIDDELGFHPSLDGFASLLEKGQLAIIQGVGYPNPNRSHFESMDIWHSCKRKTENRPDGWLGRYLDEDQQTNSANVPAIHLGVEKQPFALMSRMHRVPSVRSLEQFRLKVQHEKATQQIRKAVGEQRASSNDLLGFIQTSTETAIDVSQQFEASKLAMKTKATYPETVLGKQLKTISGLLASGLDTKIFYVQTDGFDTHSNQADAHAGLLRTVGDAVAAFNEDMVSLGESDRVLTVCFSEFGRRVSENASGGTDHGTAAPMFLAGGNVQPGLIGKHPDMSELVAGDLKFHTDFRQVYAAILEHWLGCESENVLGGKFKAVNCIKPDSQA